jgi:hypothetical protein
MSKGKPQHKTWFRLSAAEWLAIAIVASATFWNSDAPPADPTEWPYWFFDTIWELEALLILIFLLVTRDIWRHKRQWLRNFSPGAVAVGGISIVGFHPESSARNAGMHKGDVIVEYHAERDLTIDRLSDVMARIPAEEALVRVVFMRDRQVHKELVPWGPLGISAINTTVSVPRKSE